MGSLGHDICCWKETINLSADERNWDQGWENLSSLYGKGAAPLKGKAQTKHPKDGAGVGRKHEGQRKHEVH